MLSNFCILRSRFHKLVHHISQGERSRESHPKCQRCRHSREQIPVSGLYVRPKGNITQKANTSIDDVPSHGRLCRGGSNRRPHCLNKGQERAAPFVEGESGYSRLQPHDKSDCGHCKIERQGRNCEELEVPSSEE